MGWDAFTPAKKDWDRYKLKSKRLDKMFKDADKYVRTRTGTADADLRMAGLDCSACGRMLEQATGEPVWIEEEWSKQFVKKINRKANWKFKCSEEDAWAYWSARKFLETCAKAGLSIRFSY